MRGRWIGALNKEIPKRITLIDVRDKKYVLPVKLIAKNKLESFLEHAPPREKDSTSDDAIFKFPDPPDTVEVMAQVLQHGKFNNFPHWEDRRAILGNLLDVVRVGEKYHVYETVIRAVYMFDDTVKLYKDLFPKMRYKYADLADTVGALYRPDLPEGWDEMTSGELSFSRRAPRPDSFMPSYIPFLKRYAVRFAADNYLDIAYDCPDLFGKNVVLYPDGMHPFHKDVKKAMKRQKDIRAESKNKKVKMDEKSWSDFFADERYVTLVDAENDKRYLLTRKDVLEQSKFLYERAPTKAWSKDCFDEEYHAADVQAADLSPIQHLARALAAAADKYGVFGMRDAVNGLLLGCGSSSDHLARCRKPSTTIVHAVETVYALEQCGENDGLLLRELKDPLKRPQEKHQIFLIYTIEFSRS
ncbi:hypothetical protein DIS24_g8029 [Lasiodiplodia hormozganensis]|uniref:BTB domain-containing protein n=1 Tax=Lasiodiplodia hormozganensis TaxID=869390 RepID=A0AA40CPX6_9PEZI|nr:hypothetical protein DIS24_g8029 [Lasiodiplodia hormozganensis]